MRLHEHSDFAAFVTAAASENDLSEPFVEKDYWITEILRVIAATLPGRAIFKGGTSLSKGWNLLDRFSEDIDLFVDPTVEPPLAKRAIDRTLKQLRDDVVAIGGLTLDESTTHKGFGRVDVFRYESRYPAIGGFPSTIRLEPGIQSGKHPTEVVQVSSIVGDLLRTRGAAGELGAESLDQFPMTLLHFRRCGLVAGFQRLVRLLEPYFSPPRWLCTGKTVGLVPRGKSVLRAICATSYELREDVEGFPSRP